MIGRFALLQLVRPRQWVKNLFVFAPIIFARQYDNVQSWLLAIEAAAAFLAMSGVVYIFNDYKDREEDRLHPVKCRRPLASGEVTPTQAGTLAAGLLLLATGLLLGLPGEVAAVMVIYMAGNIAYTLYLKHVALIDILAIASFYVMRVLAGCYALEVMISPWIVLATFLLAMFLGFGKRYHEMSIEGYVAAKRNLQSYNRSLLDRLVMICGCAALLTYAIYAAEMSILAGSLTMVYSVIFVAFGIFRYLQALLVFGEGGEPEAILIKDPLMMINAALWLCFCMWNLS